MKIEETVDWRAVRKDLLFAMGILSYWVFGMGVVFTVLVLFYKYCRWVLGVVL